MRGQQEPFQVSTPGRQGVAPVNLSTIGRLLGFVVGGAGLTLLAPLALAIARGEPWQPFAIPLLSELAGGAALVTLFRRAERSLNHRTAFLTVSLTWASVCALGALPFWAHPSLGLGVIDSFFESTSAFTTTGATVLSGLDQMPQSLLLWRSLCQWLGGMGMVVFGVAILPLLGVGGMQLYKAEAPGLTKDKITPRIAETAKLLWMLYLGLSAAAALLLWQGGMSPFDAICHAMTTISTGGFSTHDQSLGYFDSGYIHAVVTVFMLAGGTSFAILHRSLTGGVSWSEQPELRAYLGIFAVGAGIIALELMTTMPEEFTTVSAALEHAAFQVASILTTTGFVTQDFERWPPLAHAVLFLLFFVGAMAGSTGGGIKVVRIVLLGRLAFAQIFKLVHPRGFSVVKLGDRAVNDEIVASLIGFVAMWFGLLAAGTMLLCVFGSDEYSALCASAVTLGNIGPGFAEVGPSNNYAPFGPPAKLTMSALMILGRLEIYTFLVILTPRFWRR